MRSVMGKNAQQGGRQGAPADSCSGDGILGGYGRGCGNDSESPRARCASEGPEHPYGIVKLLNNPEVALVSFLVAQPPSKL